MFYWGKGFGTDLTDRNTSQNHRDLCYSNTQEQNSNSVPLLINKNVFLCSQIACFNKEDAYAIDKLEDKSAVTYQIIDLLSYERVFIKDIDFLVDTIFPSINETKYNQIEKELNDSLCLVKLTHLKLKMKLEEMLKKSNDKLIEMFIKEITTTFEMLNAHSNYMNNYFTVENNAIDLSIEKSSEYRKELGDKVLINLIRSPIYWQKHILEVIKTLKEVMPAEILRKYSKPLQEYSDKIIEISATIDSIPKLEQISKMFILEPFPIVIPGRRFIKEGLCKKQCRNKISRRQIILFSDYLLYTQIRGNIFFSPSYFELIYLETKPYPDEEHPCSLVIYSPKKSFVIDFDTNQERDEWLQAIQTAARNAKENCDEKIELKRMAPIWYSDNETKSCMICQTLFSVFNRRHHCRGCGYVVCKNCVPNRIVIPGIEDDKPVPVCNSCFAILSKQKL